MRELTPDECKAYLEQATTSPLLLDVREPWEYRIVHLEDSQLIPMREIPAMIGTLDPHQEIIVICHHGIRSRQVALFLEHQGFSDVVNLSGGLDAWARHTDPSLPTY
ncbi:MAG TPA: rhodanese-like domain-containing protein [Gammaproteobacteria bacterium]|nr:rhodanese-like domain-containing protein [Gammaproteobacteria bacterium]